MCQKVRQTPSKLSLHPWLMPSRPLERIHIDFCESDKEHLLILIDSYSKCVDVWAMHRSTTVDRTIDELRLIVADVGPQFTAREFKEFW